MYWREGGAEVDYVVKSHRGLLAIEVKSGRVKRMGGLERFCQRYQEAQPVVLDLEKARDFWMEGTLMLKNLEISWIVFCVACSCKGASVKHAKNSFLKAPVTAKQS